MLVIDQIKKFPRKWLAIFGVGLALFAFFLAYSFFSWKTGGVYTSPDEVSNSFWSELFRSLSQLWQIYPPGTVYGEIVHPRSMRVIEGMLVPGGFVGLPVVIGGFAKLLGSAVMPYVTPFFGVIGALMCGVLLWKVTDRRLMGLWGGFLVIADPVWWYWSSRSFMPNISALALYLVASVLLVWRPFYRSWVSIVLSAVSAAIAFAIRPIDAAWFFLAAVVVAILYRVRPMLRDVLLWIGSFVFALAPFLIVHYVTYGSFLNLGYGSVGQVSADVDFFAPRTALMNAWNYLAVLFPVWVVGVVVSSVVLLRMYVRRELSASLQQFVRAWFWVCVVVGAVIVPFYGSAVLGDNPRVGAVTIGVSYTRYWLPLYLLSVVPPTIIGVWIFDRLWLWRKWVAVVVAVTMVVGTTIGAWDLVWRSRDEGLMHVVSALEKNSATAEQLFGATENNALVFTARGDKYLFPRRMVVTEGVDTPSSIALIAKHLDDTPMYVFGFSYDVAALDAFNADLSTQYSFVLKPVMSIDAETLYRIEKYVE